MSYDPKDVDYVLDTDMGVFSPGDRSEAWKKVIPEDPGWRPCYSMDELEAKLAKDQKEENKKQVEAWTVQKNRYKLRDQFVADLLPKYPHVQFVKDPHSLGVFVSYNRDIGNNKKERIHAATRRVDEVVALNLQHHGHRVYQRDLPDGTKVFNVAAPIPYEDQVEYLKVNPQPVTDLLNQLIGRV